MSLDKIGTVKSGSGQSYEVWWDPNSKNVWVKYAGGKNVGKATSAAQAMRVGEAWLYDK